MILKALHPKAWLVTPESHILDYPEIVEEAARTCYKTEFLEEPGSAEKLIRKCIDVEHESVIEHCSITAKAIMSRTASHQLVRHRLAAYSQESQRYCDYSEGKRHGFTFVPPQPLWGSIPEGEYEYEDGGWFLVGNGAWMASEEVREWLDDMRNDYERYNHYRKVRKWKAEEAREKLPNATKTEVTFSYNLRVWRHVFRHRALNKRAQPQIRLFTGEVLTKLLGLAPVFFEDLVGEEFSL